MIPVCFPIREDELFQGWLRDLAKANNIEYKYFVRLFMGQRSTVPLCYGCNLDEIVRQHYGTNHFFPDMYEIIVDHTTYTVDKTGMSVGIAAVTSETMLRKQVSKSQFKTNSEYRTCPFCKEEDKQQYSRSFVHVSHQIRGVRVCYKHGYVFEGEEDIRNIDVEMTIANFAHDLFKLSPDLTFDRVAKFVTDENINKAVSNGYLSPAEGKRIINCIRLHKYMFVHGIIRFLAWFFSGKAEKLIENISKIKQEPTNSDLFIQNDSRYGIGKYTCKTCGNIFYMSDRAVEAGTVCPLCSNQMTDKEQTERIMSRFRDGNYEYKDGMLIHKLCESSVKARSMFWLLDYEECRNCKVNDLTLLKSTFEGSEYEFVRLTNKGSRMKPREFIVRHKACGTEIELSYKSRQRYDTNKNTVKCPHCDGEIRADTKRLRAIRIGERRIGTTGMDCEVIRYDGSYDVTVRFENGLTKKMTWDHFKDIGTVKQTAMPELYIGLERVLDDGRTCKIIEYCGCKRILVEFSDGEQRWTTYKSFIKSQFKQSLRDRHAYEGQIVQVYNGTIVNTFESLSDAANQLNVSTATIKNYIKGTTKTIDYDFKVVKSEYNDDKDSVSPMQNLDHLNVSAIGNKRPVNQYDLDGHYIKTYESVSAAKKAVGVNPSNSLNSNGKIKTAGGFQWLYDTGNHMNISPVNQKRVCDKAVIQIKVDDKTVVAKYATISEASRVCGINRTNISLACRDERKTAGGYIWKYAKDDI